MQLSLVLYAVVCAFLNRPGLSSLSFWLDEAWTVDMVQSSWKEMLVTTMNDVHPPLYYLILKLLCPILHYTPFSYRLVSFLPYVILLVLAVTCFYRRLGFWPTFFFITFSSLTPQARIANAEARMYSWALLFVTLCGWALLRILDTNANQKRYWLLFAIGGIGAAYTHYYAFLMIGLLYLVLLIALTLSEERQKNLRRWGLCTVVSVVCYLPWLSAFLTTLSRTSGSFWLAQPDSLHSALATLYDDSISGWLLFTLTALALAAYLIWQCKQRPPLWWLILSALMVMVATLTIAYTVSILIRPLFLTRYLYPCFGLVWLCFGSAVQECSAIIGRRWAPCAVATLGVYSCLTTYADYKGLIAECNSQIEDSVQYIEALAEPGDVITSNAGIALRESVLSFYLPDMTVVSFTNDGSWIVPGHKTFLCTEELGFLPDDVQAQIDAAGMQAVCNRGIRLGNSYYSLYEITPVPQE